MAGALSAIAVAAAILGLASAGETAAVGDANCDGSVNSIDAALVLQLHAGLIGEVCGDVDVNGDGVANSVDAGIILQMDAGLCCPALSAELTLNSTIWLPPGVPLGERIIMVLYVTNEGEKPLTRRYTSGQSYEFVVHDSLGSEVWRWSHGMAFTDAIEHRVFEAGETVFYRVEWNQEDDAGEQIPPGSYTVSAVDVGCSLLPPRSCDLGDSSELEILPPPDPIDCTGDNLETRLTVDGGSTSFAAGEFITLEFTIKNCSQPSITRFASPPIGDFSVLDSVGAEIWRASHGLLFPGVFLERTYEPDKSITFYGVWNQLSNGGDPVEPAKYEVRGHLTGCNADPPKQCDLIASQTIEIVP